MEEAISWLLADSKKKIKIIQPPHPIFESISLLQLRALIFVIIGYDVSPKGVERAGLRWVANRSAGFQEAGISESEMYNSLLNFTVEKSKPLRREDASSKYNRDILYTLVLGSIYEPTNELLVQCVVSLADWTYMVPPTQQLPKYLAEFWSNATEIDNGPKICWCNGSHSDSSN